MTSGRPRVLHLGPDPAMAGGMAAVTRALMESPLGERYRLEAVPTYRGTRPVRRLALFLWAVIRLIAWSVTGRGRIVHVHATVRGSMYRKSACVLVARALRRRVVLQIHSGPGDIAAFRAGLGRLRVASFASALRLADTVVAVSSASAAALEAAYGVKGIVVVPNPAPPVTSRQPRARGGRVEAIYVGGFANPAKGGDVLLAALDAALARVPDLHVVLAGPGELPPLGRELVERGDAVEWVGWLDRDALAAALDSADVFVLSSLSEGLPVALLEAMSRGLAIVATTVGGVPDVVASGHDALLVPPGAPAELAAALERVAGDDDLRTRIGAGARDRASKLSPAEVAKEIEALYSALA